MDPVVSVVSLASASAGLLIIFCCVLLFRKSMNAGIALYVCLLALFSLNLFADGILFGFRDADEGFSRILEFTNIVVSALVIPVLFLLGVRLGKGSIGPAAGLTAGIYTALLLALSVTAHGLKTADSPFIRTARSVSFVVWSVGLVSALIFLTVTGILQSTRSRSPYVSRFLLILGGATIVFIPFLMLRDVFPGRTGSPFRIELFARPVFFLFWNIVSIVEYTRYLRDGSRNAEPGGRDEKSWERAAQFAGLTDRELEVARMLSKGIPYKEIADSLGISLPTVKTHASNVYAKTGVANRTALAEWVDSLGPHAG